MKLYNSFLGALAGAVLTLTAIGCKHNSSSSLPNYKPDETIELIDEFTGESIKIQRYEKDNRECVVVKNYLGHEIDAYQGLAALVWENGEFDDRNLEFDGHKYVSKWADLLIGTYDNLAWDLVDSETGEKVSKELPTEQYLQVAVSKPVEKNLPSILLSTYILYNESVGPVSYLATFDYQIDGLDAEDGDFFLIPIDIQAGIWNKYLLSDAMPEVVSPLQEDNALVIAAAFKAAEKEWIINPTLEKTD